MQRGVGRWLLPRRHHEATVTADVEVGVAQRCARPRREIGRSGDVASIHCEQVGGGGAEIGVPVPDRVAGMQDRGDLGVLAQIPQPTVVVDGARRRQQRCAHHHPRATARRPDGFDAAWRCQDLDGLAAGPGKVPQRSGRLVVVLGRAHRDEHQVVVRGERRCRLALGTPGQPAGRGFALRVEFPHRRDVGGALLVELADRRDDPRAVCGHRKPGHPRQREVLVEIAERGFGHATFVAQGVSLISKLTTDRLAP